jgi:hypothetical protein
MLDQPSQLAPSDEDSDNDGSSSENSDEDNEGESSSDSDSASDEIDEEYVGKGKGVYGCLSIIIFSNCSHSKSMSALSLTLLFVCSSQQLVARHRVHFQSSSYCFLA